MMRRCPHCEAELPAVRDAFCASCRQPLSEDSATDRPFRFGMRTMLIAVTVAAVLSFVFGKAAMVGARFFWGEIERATTVGED